MRPLADIYVESGLCESKSAFRRLVDQGGATATLPNGKKWKIKDPQAVVVNIGGELSIIEIDRAMERAV